MLTLALSLQLLTAAEPPPSLHLVERPAARPGLLLAQSPVSAREAELQGQIDDLNSRIRGISTDWPLASLLGAWLGFGAAAAIPVGLIITLVGVVAASAGAGILVIVGLVVTAVGVAGLVVGILSVVSGGAAQEEGRSQRAELVRQRESLERELKALRQNPQGVERLQDGPPTLLTLATF